MSVAVRHCILIVDDEPDVTKSLKNLFRLDYDIVEANSAAQAMEILRERPVQVVMTDHRMPDMTGVELLREVHKDHPDVIRLLFTGYADIHAVIDAINKGHVYRYITKPWNPEELLTIIRDACAFHDLLLERKQMVSELQNKNAELKQTNELKSAFIKVVSHEFRTPITILGGLCKLAMLEQSGAGEVSDDLKQINEAAERLQRLVNQTVSMLSAERFDATFRQQSHDLTSVLTQAADDVRPFMGLRHQEFHMDLPPDLGSLNVDAEKIRDTLNHLLLNAIKFTPDGGSVTLCAVRKNDGVMIAVSDTGSGIAPELIPRLFEPFFTGFEISTHSSGHYEHGTKGMGLGLSLVRAFVEMHGGKVWMQSDLGKGSTFSLFLPDNAQVST